MTPLKHRQSSPLHGNTPIAHAIAPARAIAVCGGIDGIGKTTLVTSLGFALARQGSRVCLLDADTAVNNVGASLGLIPPYGFDDYVQGQVELDNALWSIGDGIQIIQGIARMNSFDALPRSKRRRVNRGLHRLESIFDYLLIDCASGSDENQLQLIQAAPFVILVLGETERSQTEAFALLRALLRRGLRRPVMVIANRAASPEAAHLVFQRFDKACRQYLKVRVHFLGYVVEDECVAEAARRQVPFLEHCEDSPAGRLLRITARRLHEVASRVESARGEFSTWFDARQLAAEAGARPPTREELMRHLRELVIDMDEREIVRLLADIQAIWERHSGTALTMPARPSVQDNTAPVRSAPSAPPVATTARAADTSPSKASPSNAAVDNQIDLASAARFAASLAKAPA